MKVRIVKSVLNNKEYYKVQYKKICFIPYWKDYQKETITSNGEISYVKWFQSIDDAWDTYMNHVHFTNMTPLNTEIVFSANIVLKKTKKNLLMSKKSSIFAV